METCTTHTRGSPMPTALPLLAAWSRLGPIVATGGLTLLGADQTAPLTTHCERRCPVGERDCTPAQDWSALDFIEARAALQHDLERDGRVPGDRVPDDSRHYLDFMRNAWVAYHAGAPWMRGDFELFQELTIAELRGVRAEEQNARLRAEVERLAHERDVACGDLGSVMAVLFALRDAAREAVSVLREAGGSDTRKQGEVQCILEDALAREDGADSC